VWVEPACACLWWVRLAHVPELWPQLRRDEQRGPLPRRRCTGRECAACTAAASECGARCAARRPPNEARARADARAADAAHGRARRRRVRARQARGGHRAVEGEQSRCFYCAKCGRRVRCDTRSCCAAARRVLSRVPRPCRDSALPSAKLKPTLASPFAKPGEGKTPFSSQYSAVRGPGAAARAARACAALLCVHGACRGPRPGRVRGRPLFACGSRADLDSNAAPRRAASRAASTTAA
jgi:hypothetical protein